ARPAPFVAVICTKAGPSRSAASSRACSAKKPTARTPSRPPGPPAEVFFLAALAPSWRPGGRGFSGSERKLAGVFGDRLALDRGEDELGASADERIDRALHRAAERARGGAADVADEEHARARIGVAVAHGADDVVEERGVALALRVDGDGE